MLWIKALHIFFVISWSAGLFYLPRIFVNLAMETETVATERLLLMAPRLRRPLRKSWPPRKPLREPPSCLEQIPKGSSARAPLTRRKPPREREPPKDSEVVARVVA